MTTEKMEDRPYKLCDSCGQVDKAPKHLHFGSVGEFPTPNEFAVKAIDNKPADMPLELLIAELMDTSSQQKHLDCCMSDGCPDSSCTAVHGSTPAPDEKPLQNEALFKFIKDDKNNVGKIGIDLNEQRYQDAEALRELEGSDK